MLLAGSAPLMSQTLTVPASSDVYRRIEAVSALFPARGVQLGQRPMSRRELARVVRALDLAVDSSSRPTARREWARAELAAIRDALGTEAHRETQVLTAVRAQSYTSDARIERIVDNGLASLDALTNPFAPGRYAWPVHPGADVTLAPTVGVERSGLAVLAEPRYSLMANAGSMRGDVEVHRAYVRGVLANVALQAGADELFWGQSPHGALFLSGNAQPFPAVMLASDTAFTMPWLLRLFGPTRAAIFLGDLGPSQSPAHSKLAGWITTFQPWTRFEISMSVLQQTGPARPESAPGAGDSIPHAGFVWRLIDLFPAIDALAPQHSDLQFSNKLAGGNLRLLFPELSGLEVYYELEIDDFDARRFVSSMVDDAAHLLGFQFRTGDIAWRAEWNRTSLRLYEHTQFKSGVTYRGQLLGDPLGPHALAGYAGAEWRPSHRTRVDLSVADERRDPSKYASTYLASRDRGFHYVRLTNDPDVRRARGILSVEREYGRGALRVDAGYNRAWRDGQAARHEWMGQVSFATRLLPTF